MENRHYSTLGLEAVETEENAEKWITDNAGRIEKAGHGMKSKPR